MSRRFLNTPSKEDGWKRLQRYSGDLSPFYVRHDTFIRVTDNESQTGSLPRNFTIRKRTLEESEQLHQALEVKITTNCHISRLNRKSHFSIQDSNFVMRNKFEKERV